MSGPVRILRATLLVAPRLESPFPGRDGFGVSDADGPLMAFPDSASGRRLAAVIPDGCDQADTIAAEHAFAQDPQATGTPA